MIIRNITDIIEDLSPLTYAEDFDNVGLLVGDYNTKVRGVLVTLDTLEITVDEAIARNCNLIVSFHPIIFKGLKKINGSNYVERVIIKAIKNDIAIYSMHTALDNSFKGVSAKMCEIIGLHNTKILIPKSSEIKKLSTYVPHENAENLRNVLFKAGAGNIGNYDHCSFNIKGEGTYRGNEDSNPTIGDKNNIHTEPETNISLIFEKHLEGKVLKALFTNHPYEEVAYEIIALNDNMIKKVAVLGGSGSFAIEKAITNGADIYISSDFKYHDFFRAENKIILADIGHYESEQFTKTLLVDYLTKKITNFAAALPVGRIILSKNNTNPINYF